MTTAGQDVGVTQQTPMGSDIMQAFWSGSR